MAIFKWFFRSRWDPGVGHYLWFWYFVSLTHLSNVSQVHFQAYLLTWPGSLPRQSAPPWTCPRQQAGWFIHPSIHPVTHPPARLPTQTAYCCVLHSMSWAAEPQFCSAMHPFSCLPKFSLLRTQNVTLANLGQGFPFGNCLISFWKEFGSFELTDLKNPCKWGFRRLVLSSIRKHCARFWRILLYVIICLSIAVSNGGCPIPRLTLSSP